MHIVLITISSIAHLPHVYALKAMKTRSIFYWVVVGFILKELFFSSLANISPTIDFSDTRALSHLLLYGSKDLSFYANTDILNATIAFISSFKRFEKLEAFQEV